AEMSVSRICWDTGGIDPTIVYERSKKHGLFRVIPIKGASVYGKPVASMPRKRNKNGVYLTEIGTDKGKYTMTGEAFDPVEVDMGRSEENNITQSGGTEWSKRDKSTYDPTDDIEAYALNASGVVNIIVFDPKGWALFRSFKAVKEKLDTRRGSNSELETAVKDLGKAVSYKGMYGDVAIVVYSGQYVENGVKKNFLPDNTMVLGNTQARGLRTYGCIQDADAQREGINASARYPKNWVTTGDPAREFTMIQSAPLMLLADPDEFVSVQLA
uniref:terminase gpA endonuclease subunit n=1 Tax=Escherichia coli TaxID=562 RepID=UPI001F4072B5